MHQMRALSAQTFIIDKNEESTCSGRVASLFFLVFSPLQEVSEDASSKMFSVSLF
ncbi:unnamed protein product [Larinioides sclopetarius]|uniref:Uncharacterized protein n=1 Tax=Larinioides sclopetarius TaxID=280406 RepID=A0AAV2ATI5_9ARAC